MGGERILQGLREAVAIAKRESGRHVLVCGGRDYRDKSRVYEVLDGLHVIEPIGLVIEGGQRTWSPEEGRFIGGADHWAHKWAAERGVGAMTVRADWKKHGRAAGPMRNKRMLEHAPDLVVCFPGGRGTKNMREQAEAAGFPTLLIE